MSEPTVNIDFDFSTPTPWSLDPEAPEHVLDAQGRTLVMTATPRRPEPRSEVARAMDHVEQLDNAKRVVAAVNAFEGIVTPAIGGRVQDLIDVLYRVMCDGTVSKYHRDAIFGVINRFTAPGVGYYSYVFELPESSSTGDVAHKQQDSVADTQQRSERN